MAKKRAKKKADQNGGRSWLWYATTIISALSALAFLVLFLFFIILLFAANVGPMGNIAVIPIQGVIVVDGQPGLGQEITTSTKLVKLLTQADEDTTVDAIILEINSPGGSAVASAEIADKIKTIEKPVYSVIRSTGASGAYWIASSTDKIYTHRFAVTGSIGVIGSYLEFAELLDNYNITYRRMVAGKYKDAGSPFKELSDEEAALFQKLLDDIHAGFIEEVATNRNLSTKHVRDLATGFVYLGQDAVELGLADEIGNIDKAVDDIEEKLNITADIARYQTKTTIFEQMGIYFQEAAYNVGLGMGKNLKPQAKGLEIIS
ncbi:MAG: signal peptide peptidase SppA [Candidatus Nanoarchaeia archaeon]